MQPRGVRGWLLVLCLLLLVWQPLGLALVASSVLDELAIRGLSLALVLLLRLLVAALASPRASPSSARARTPSALRRRRSSRLPPSISSST